jgi:aldehyde dehydrogenase (NAD+)
MSRRPCCATCRTSIGWCRKKIFGPVQVIMPFDSEDEGGAAGQRHLLRLGLRRLDCGRRTADAHGARAVQAGQVFINNYGAGGGVELPFGGVKKIRAWPRKGVSKPFTASPA